MIKIVYITGVGQEVLHYIVGMLTAYIVIYSIAKNLHPLAQGSSPASCQQVSLPATLVL